MADQVPPVTPEATVQATTPPVAEVVAPVVTVDPPAADTNAPAPEKVPEITAEALISDKKPETALGADPAKTEPPKDKAPEVKADAVEPKKEEGSQSAEPAPLPTYESFTIPEGVTFDDVKLGEFTKELGTFQNLTKADQAEVQKFGQTLINRHVADVQENINRLNEHYVNTWEKQKTSWKEAFEKDPEIGGNRKNTTVNAALEFIRTHGGTDAQQKEFRDLMETTGLGNHPAIIRMLANANVAKAEGKPLPATTPAPQAKNKIDQRYVYGK